MLSISVKTRHEELSGTALAGVGSVLHVATALCGRNPHSGRFLYFSVLERSERTVLRAHKAFNRKDLRSHLLTPSLGKSLLILAHSGSKPKGVPI